MVNLHSTTSPSRLERIINCPGSVQACALCEEGKTSTYAEEGTLLHRATDEASNLGIDAIDYIDADGKNAVEDCLDYKQSIINSLGHEDYAVSQEIQVSLTSWNIPEVYGTLDLGILDRKNRHAHIADWKFGRGVIVYALWNPQLLSYGAGYIGNPPVADTVTLHIVQPRIEHYDRWTITIKDLTDWVNNTLKRAVALSQSKNPPINPGEKQCQWCEAKNQCPARHKQTMADAALIFNAATNIKLIGNKDIAECLKLIPRIKNSIKSLEAYAYQELDRGREMPGFKLVAGRSVRKWKNEDDALKWLSEFSAIEELFVSKAISCAQAEKKDRSLKKNSEFHNLIVKPEGKKTIVPETDKRPEISSKAVDVFRKVQI